jgi:hypothetical protein
MGGMRFFCAYSSMKAVQANANIGVSGRGALARSTVRVVLRHFVLLFFSSADKNAIIWD